MAAGHAKPNHDYHLVPLSPWPLVGSVSAFVMAVGGIMWMKSINAFGMYVFIAGLLGVLYTMAAWWTDVVREAQHGDHTRVVQMSHRYGMILFIASEVMFFVAWFWAYFDVALYPHEAIEYARTQAIGGMWPPKGTEALDPWHFPLFNTLLLLTSGTTLGAVFALFAGFYYWFPKMSGYMYNETLGKLHFWMMFVGVNVTFFPQHFLGLAGMPRRYIDYPDAYRLWNEISSYGAYLSGASVFLFLFIIYDAFAKKRVAGDNPWGAGATTLEWTLSSPPPYHQFETLPRITAAGGH